MLTQIQADNLLKAAKVLVDSNNLSFPQPGGSLILEAESMTGADAFIIDVNRRGKINVSKCTYQTRYNRIEILLRVDIAGPPHTNPDGVEVQCPHIHIYREGYSDKWAYPLTSKMPTTVSDLGQVLRDFLLYNNITNVPAIHSQGGGIV